MVARDSLERTPATTLPYAAARPRLVSKLHAAQRDQHATAAAARLAAIPVETFPGRLAAIRAR